MVGARHDLMTRLCAAYIDAAADSFGFDSGTLERWRAVAAAARVAELLPAAVLRDLWRRWLSDA